MLLELRHYGGAEPQFIPVEGFPAGLLYGMGVYTTFRYPLQAQWIAAHLDRLAGNAQQLGLPMGFSPAVIQAALTPHWGLGKTILRLTAVADVQEYSNFYNQPQQPARLLLSLREAPAGIPWPVALKTVDYTRPMPLLKHLGMAEVIALKQKACQEGFQDILLAGNGLVREASTANLFVIEGDVLNSPHPERDGCLPGITRLRVLAAAKGHGIIVQDGSPIARSALSKLDGAFLTNAAQGIVPVARINEFTLPWPTTATKLMAVLAEALAC
jgi:branched-subunit amino acid aminotransferase/4-amino-4-deoxychorismate lyase